MRLLKNFYRKILPNYHQLLIKELKNLDMVLELGCGKDSPMKKVSGVKKVGVDIYLPYILESKKKQIHDFYILGDIRNIEFKRKTFDAVVLLDVIEHLDKQDGIDLIKKVEEFVKKKIIIFTPNGYLEQDEYDENPYQVHLSGWTVEDFKNLGFNRIYGTQGWKRLRGERSLPIFKPHFFWDRIIDVTEQFLRNRPEKSFSIFAVKDLE